MVRDESIVGDKGVLQISGLNFLNQKAEGVDNDEQHGHHRHRLTTQQSTKRDHRLATEACRTAARQRCAISAFLRRLALPSEAECSRASTSARAGTWPRAPIAVQLIAAAALEKSSASCMGIPASIA